MCYIICKSVKGSCLKGIVHPKMKIFPSFTHPHIVPNLYKFLSYLEHKSSYFEEQNSCWPSLTSIVGGKILWKSMGAPSTAFFKISSFTFNMKKLIQVWNDMRVSKWGQKFHFGVNYSLNTNEVYWISCKPNCVDFLTLCRHGTSVSRPAPTPITLCCLRLWNAGLSTSYRPCCHGTSRSSMKSIAATWRSDFNRAQNYNTFLHWKLCSRFGWFDEGKSMFLY